MACLRCLFFMLNRNESSPIFSLYKLAYLDILKKHNIQKKKYPLHKCKSKHVCVYVCVWSWYVLYVVHMRYVQPTWEILLCFRYVVALFGRVISWIYIEVWFLLPKIEYISYLFSKYLYLFRLIYNVVTIFNELCE